MSVNRLVSETEGDPILTTVAIVLANPWSCVLHLIDVTLIFLFLFKKLVLLCLRQTFSPILNS